MHGPSYSILRGILKQRERRIRYAMLSETNTLAEDSRSLVISVVRRVEIACIPFPSALS